MHIICKLFFTLILPFAAFGNNIEYQIVDLGLLEMDKSYAFAINDNSQILGECSEGSFRSFFLWSKGNIKFIDIPDNCNMWSVKLNNKGQIAGTFLSNGETSLFTWDERKGFQIVFSTKEGLSLIALNDQGKVLCQIGNQMVLFSNKHKIDLTKLFQSQIAGNWSWFRAVALNNEGHVALRAHRNEDEARGEKSFIFKNGLFEMIMPEKNWKTEIIVEDMDDEGNLLVNVIPREGGQSGQHFISSTKPTPIRCLDCDILRNGIPIRRDSLPSKMKRDRLGKPYFPKGVEIKKILKIESPFYKASKELEINAQNSRGHVIGNCDTLYSRNHAFLAIPILLEQLKPLNTVQLDNVAR